MTWNGTLVLGRDDGKSQEVLRQVFRVLYGSHAHGTSTPTSDKDYRGVFLLPNETLLGLSDVRQTWDSALEGGTEKDMVYWELGHYCRLLIKGNPNIVGMLFAPDDVVEDVHPAFRPLIENRKLFLHAGTVEAYRGWVYREYRDLDRLAQKGPPTPKVMKRLSHLPRLAWELLGALEDGFIQVRPTPDRLAQIMAIKTGYITWLEAWSLTNRAIADMEAAADANPLPPVPWEWTDRYLVDARKKYG